MRENTHRYSIFVNLEYVGEKLQILNSSATAILCELKRKVKPPQSHAKHIHEPQLPILSQKTMKYKGVY